jgi:hypothetical protein
LSNANKIRVLFIDAHGFTFKDFNLIPMGAFRGITVDKKWYFKDTQFHNFYQQEKYPKGAKMKGGNSNVELKNENHYTIESSEPVITKINQILIELKGE